VVKKSWKVVPEAEWRGRLANARAFLKAGQDLLEMAEDSSIGNPILTQAIDAVIAFADAASIKFGQIQNTADHRGLAKTLKAAIGTRFPRAQEQRLGKLLSWKDDAHYGHRAASVAEASKVIQLAERFAEWAEAELARP
jgi:hypothetical protein